MSINSFFLVLTAKPSSVVGPVIGHVIGTIITVFLVFCVARLTLEGNVLQYITEDWLCRLPDRLDRMPFKGFARPCYTLLCLLYYSLKTIFILIFAGIIHIYKFLFWDIPKWLYSVIESAVRQHFLKKSKKEPPLATGPQESSIHTLWYHGNEEMWKSALDFYWSDFNEQQYQRELLVNETDPKRIETLSPKEFFDFLHQTYFPWKYTDARYLSRNRKYLEKYLLENNLNELACIQKQIFSTDLQDIKNVCK